MAVASPVRSRTSDSFGGDLGPAAIKGGILVLVALVLGIALLLQGTGADLEAASPGDGDQSDGGSGTPDTTEAGQTDDTSATTEATTTTSVAARPPDEVTVLVANGSGIPGAAAAVGTQLQGLGYLTAEPDNTPAPVTTSNVYYIPGFEAEARAVATSLGLDPDAEGVV